MDSINEKVKLGKRIIIIWSIIGIFFFACFAPCIYSIHTVIEKTKIENLKPDKKDSPVKITFSYITGEIPTWNLNLISIGGAIVTFIGFILTVNQSIIAKKAALEVNNLLEDTKIQTVGKVQRSIEQYKQIENDVIIKSSLDKIVSYYSLLVPLQQTTIKASNKFLKQIFELIEDLKRCEFINTEIHDYLFTLSTNPKKDYSQSEIVDMQEHFLKYQKIFK